MTKTARVAKLHGNGFAAQVEGIGDALLRNGTAYVTGMIVRLRQRYRGSITAGMSYKAQEYYEDIETAQIEVVSSRGRLLTGSMEIDAEAFTALARAWLDWREPGPTLYYSYCVNDPADRHNGQISMTQHASAADREEASVRAAVEGYMEDYEQVLWITVKPNGEAQCETVTWDDLMDIHEAAMLAARGVG